MPNSNHSASAVPTIDELNSRFHPIFKEIAAGAAERDLRRVLPREQITRLKEAGFTALRIPREYGGLNATFRQTFALLIDLAAADSNIVQSLRAHFTIVEEFLEANDVDGLKQIGQGLIFGNATSEKGVGNVGRFQTALTPDPANPNDYLLNGSKFYSTGSLYSDVIKVAADLDGERAAAEVPADAKGVRQYDDWDGFGQKLTGSGTTIFENVSVKAENVKLSKWIQGAHQPYTAYFQLFHLAALAGIARGIADDVAERVKNRKRTFSHASADLPRNDPLVQSVLGRVYSASFVARAAVLDVADTISKAFGKDSPEYWADQAELQSAQAQVTLIPLVLYAITDAFETGGASIVAEEANLDRYWRNARTVAVHNPAIYKQRAVGEYFLTGDANALPFTWAAGVRTTK